MNKRRCLWLLVMLLFVAVPVRGEGNGGSIRLVMRCQGSAVSGGSVRVYDVTDLDRSVDPEVMAQVLLSTGIIGRTAEIGMDGTVCFADLETGYYLLVQERAAPGYLVVKPFYISIPITVGDQVQYHVEAFPKLQRIPQTQLPQTGQAHLPVWVLMSSGLALTGLGFFLQKRK